MDQLTRRCRHFQAQRGACGSRRRGGVHLELLQCDMDFGLVEEGGGVLRHRSQHSLIILRGQRAGRLASSERRQAAGGSAAVRMPPPSPLPARPQPPCQCCVKEA
jgi:hypothetical protein